MSRITRIGVLGCANIAERFILPAIQQSDLFELAGVASRSKSKADFFSNTFNTRAFYSYDSLLEEDLDAIYIPLPNSMHYEWIKKALNKKLHVLVEKSMACNLDQVKELNQLAENKKLAFKHGAKYFLPDGKILIPSYHPSPRNVNTNKINLDKMVKLLKKIKKLI